MANDTITKRYATLTDNESNGSVTGNRKLEINIDAAYPFIQGAYANRLFTDGANYGIIYDRTSDNIIAAASNTNAIVDESDGSRYIFLGRVMGMFSYAIRDFYYDSKFKDIISIPETSAYNTSTGSSNTMVNTTRQVVGFRYGGQANSIQDMMQADFALGSPGVSNVEITGLTARGVSSKLVIGRVVGIDSPRNAVNAGVVSGDVVSVTVNAVTPFQLLKIVLSETPTFNGYSYEITNGRGNRHSLVKYGKMGDVGEFIIPIFY